MHYQSIVYNQNLIYMTVSFNIEYRTNWGEEVRITGSAPELNNGMMESVAALMPQIEQMLPKLDSIMTSLNTILGDQSIPATLHSVEKMAANLEVTSGQLKVLMGRDIPQLTGKLNTLGDNFISISDN